MTTWQWAGVATAALLFFWGVGAYNRLMSLRNAIGEAFAQLDTHLKAEDFFNVAKFPTLTFKSNKLKFDGDKLVGVDGDFTMLGVTKPLSLTVSNFKCGAHPFNKKAMCGAEVTGTVKRSDFGMKYGLPAIGDDIKLLIQVEAFKS